MKRWLAAATLFFVAAISIVCLGTTATSTATYSYDAPPVPRGGVLELDAADATSILLRGVLEVSASPSVETRGTSATPSGSVVATKAVDDHIVLGIREGLDDTASSMGGRTLLNDPNWRTTLMESIGNPNTRFTVSLDGFSGAGTYSQVMGAAQWGATPLARATEWEIMQLQQAGRLGDVTFVRGGQAVPNPWAG